MVQESCPLMGYFFLYYGSELCSQLQMLPTIIHCFSNEIEMYYTY